MGETNIIGGCNNLKKQKKKKMNNMKCIYLKNRILKIVNVQHENEKK